MQGVKQRSPKLFYQFSLEEMVPEDHPYRKLEQKLDLRFLYEHTAGYYGKDGQKSIDPVIFFKMCLIGYLNNIASDRALVRYCKDSLSARWFIGYDIDEKIPVHCTLSRTRALFGEQVYEQVFKVVLGMCVQKGMVSGKRQVADSALVKANASLDSMRRKVIMEDASEYCRQVQTENTESPTDSPQKETEQQEEEETSSVDSTESSEAPNSKKSPLKAVEAVDPEKKAHPRRSNKTHQSSSDPDSRMTRKRGKPTDLYYRGHISVDSAEGVIVAAMADDGDRDDHRALPELIEQVSEHLSRHQLSTKELVADSKYNTCHSIKACQQAGITGYMPNPSGYKREREGFIYDEESDSYRCSQGVELPFKRLQKNRGGKYANKVYQSAPGDCKDCPLRGECLSAKANRKTLMHSSGKELYDQMDDRLQTDKGQRLMGERKGIVEPVFGNLLDHYGMRKVYSRGKPAADKHVMMAAAAYNLKKWLKKPAHRPSGLAMTAQEPRLEPNVGCFYFRLWICRFFHAKKHSTFF
jgi:transposase